MPDQPTATSDQFQQILAAVRLFAQDTEANDALGDAVSEAYSLGITVGQARTFDHLTAERDRLAELLVNARVERDEYRERMNDLVDQRDGLDFELRQIREQRDAAQRLHGMWKKTAEDRLAPVPGSSPRAPEPAADVLEKAKPWATPCGRHDYGEPTVSCTCPEGDPRPVMSRLVAEIERLRNAAPQFDRAALIAAERNRIADWLLAIAHPNRIDDWKTRHDVPGKYAAMALRAAAADLSSGEPVVGLDDAGVTVHLPAEDIE